MRTNIDLDEGLLSEVAEIVGTTTKRSTVEAALREVIRIHALRDLADLRLDIDDTRGPVSA
ncbi:MAG: type II toxin-antitoxin system VapB family antitoxin [Actinomycetota bacterium]|jgi:Arc/MetJ family transcription regulator|nr:type II toxin-antitoxin system VapB family antitoxin [Actinomycetota bacterium]